MMVSVSLMVISFYFMGATIGLEHWVTWGIQPYDYKMGIRNCESCPRDHANWSWGCFADEYCEMDRMDGLCDLGHDGQNASNYYLAFEALAMIALTLLIEHAILDMNNKDHGPRWIPYIFAAMALGFHMLATALWFSTIDAKWEDECDDFYPSDERPEVCVE